MELSRNLAKSRAGAAPQKQSLRLKIHVRDVGTGLVPPLGDLGWVTSPSKPPIPSSTKREGLSRLSSLTLAFTV